MFTVKDNFTVVQITDPHLFADKASRLHGYPTYMHLVETIDHISLNANLKPDMIFVTGDISQDETAGSYQLALAQLERLPYPIFWIHGNHDNKAMLQTIFDSSRQLRQLTQLSTPYWDFISINTCRYGFDEGYIGENEYKKFLVKLESAKTNNKKVAVVMHHHPAPVHTPLMDACILQDHEKFLTLASERPEIKLMMCGHVHGDYKITRDKFVIETCPATCFQWTKGATGLETEDTRGYKIFNFNSTTYTSSTVFI